MNGKIFISYRRDDSREYAQSLAKELNRHFGKDNVFLDTMDIGPGAVWRDVAEQHVADADVVLVLIGTKWLDITDKEGNRRLDDPEDMVREEVRMALERTKAGDKIIPVLVGGASMPMQKDLPGPLGELCDYNAVSIKDSWFVKESGFLVASLREILHPDSPAPFHDALDKLRRRIGFRRLCTVAAECLAVLVFLCSWIGLIDLTLFQVQRSGNLWTAALGNWRAEKTFREDIALIIMDQATEQTFRRTFHEPGNKAFWRSKHAELIAKLSDQAGAPPRVIAFDIAFEGEEGEADRQFAEAARSATKNGSAVLVCGRSFTVDRPPLPATIGGGVGGWGNPGVELHRGIAYAVPLATLKRLNNVPGNTYSDPFAVEDPTGSTTVQKGEREGVVIPAFSLACFAVYRDHYPDHQPRFRFDPLALTDQVRVDYVQTRRTGQEGGHDVIQTDAFSCFEVTPNADPRSLTTPIREKGDAFAAMTFDLSPRDRIRDQSAKYENVLDLSTDEVSRRFAGRLVLIGRADKTDEHTVRWTTKREKRWGIELHADAVNALIKQRSIYAPAPGMQLILMAAIFALGAFVRSSLANYKWVWHWSALLGLIAAYFYVSMYFYARLGMLLSLFDGILALALSFFLVNRVNRILS